MSNLSVSSLDMEKYREINSNMTSGDDKCIYFEGKVNKNYYQKLEFFRRYTLSNGGSCSEIIKKVKKSKVNIGIIDGDFDVKKVERVYQIDFYSIENIVLYMHGEDCFKDLIDLLTYYYDSVDLIRDRIDCEFKGKYTIIKSRNIDKQYYMYIDCQIKSLETFFKYMDLKKVVNSFVTTELKQKRDNKLMSLKELEELKKRNKFFRKYIENTKEIELDELFEQDVLRRLKNFE